MITLPNASDDIPVDIKRASSMFYSDHKICYHSVSSAKSALSSSVIPTIFKPFTTNSFFIFDFNFEHALHTYVDMGGFMGEEVVVANPVMCIVPFRDQPQVFRVLLRPIEAFHAMDIDMPHFYWNESLFQKHML